MFLRSSGARRTTPGGRQAQDCAGVAARISTAPFIEFFCYSNLSAQLLLPFRFPVGEGVEQGGAQVKAVRAAKSGMGGGSGGVVVDADVKGITQAMGSASIKEKKGKR